MTDYTNPQDEGYLSAIGRLTVSWAHLEAAIDFMVNLAFFDMGNPANTAEKPVALKRKLQFLRRSLRTLSAPPEQMGEWMTLFDQIAAESITRHDIIHGVVVRHIEGSGQTTTVRLLHTKDGFAGRMLNLAQDDILKAAIRANRLADGAIRCHSALKKNLPNKSQSDGERSP